MPFDDDPVFEAVGFVADGHLVDADGVTDLTISRLDGLTAWSAWLPFADAVAQAPTDPGVYVAREGAAGPIVYVGKAGPRNGKGLRGRLRVYASGKAFTSGLGEAVADRALADPVWLRERLAEVEAGESQRATSWGRLAFERAGLHVRWATTPDGPGATALELACIGALADVVLWNRRR